jgi:hypothetical protein
MAVYQVSRPPKQRYTAMHFGAAALLLVVFATAYYKETAGYQERVLELYKNLPPRP